MPPVSRNGDIGSGHDACPPTPVNTYSSNVKAQGKNVARQNDTCASHGCIDHPVHPRPISGCSGTVKVNGRGIVRIGDAISCGGALIEGASKVSAGG